MRRKRKPRATVTDPSSPLFDEFDMEKTCSSKSGYPSEWTAKFAADETSSMSGARIGFYRCPYCGLFHLTELR